MTLPAYRQNLETLAQTSACKSDTRTLICDASTFVDEAFSEYSVLYFSKHLEEFVVLTNNTTESFILPLVSRLEIATGFKWDTVVIKAYDYNAQLKEAQERMND